MYVLKVWYPRGKDSTKFQNIEFVSFEKLIEFDRNLDPSRHHDGEAIGTSEHGGWYAHKNFGHWGLYHDSWK